MLAVAAVGIIAALAGAAWRQTAYWSDSETLWRRDLMYPKQNLTARYNLGLALAEKGRHREAIEQYKAGLEIDPKDRDSLNNLALAYEAVRDKDNAKRQYEIALGLATADNDEKAAEDFRRRLEAYQSGKPSRSEAAKPGSSAKADAKQHRHLPFSSRQASHNSHQLHQ